MQKASKSLTPNFFFDSHLTSSKSSSCYTFASHLIKTINLLHICISSYQNHQLPISVCRMTENSWHRTFFFLIRSSTVVIYAVAVAVAAIDARINACTKLRNSCHWTFFLIRIPSHCSIIAFYHSIWPKHFTIIIALYHSILSWHFIIAFYHSILP